MSAYWHDIDNNFYEILNNMGVKVVSFGFRWDARFIQRMRAIFEIVDHVVTYGFTTAVVYALAMKKPLTIQPINIHTVADKKVLFREDEIFLAQNERQKCLDMLKKYRDVTTDMLSTEERNLLNYYYGLNIKLTPEEIRAIYEVSCDIWQACDGVIRDYPLGVYKTYQRYQDDYNFEKLVVLSKACGQGAFLT